MPFNLMSGALGSPWYAGGGAWEEHWSHECLSTQLELALGSFPYGKWTTIFDQLNAVVNGEPPRLPEDGRFSKELHDFAAAW